MKWKQGLHRLGLVLLVLLVVGLVPTTARADDETGKRFILTAQTKDRLIIAPTYVYHQGGETTMREALGNSGYTLTGLDMGMVTAIEGYSGSFTRSDQTGSYDLTKLASRVTHFWFSENPSSGSAPTANRMALMTQMAEYQLKDADVQKAAKQAYDNAKAVFVDVDDDSALTLAITLEKAMKEYEDVQSGPQHKVRFVDSTGNLYQNKKDSYPDVAIAAVNQYGKIWQDDGDGILDLPAGTYTFTINQNGLGVSCVAAISGDQTVTASLPTTLWLQKDAFRISGSFGIETNQYNKFTDMEFTQQGTWDGRSFTVPVPDTFSGAVYAYVEYNEALLTGNPTLSAHYQMRNDAKTDVNQTISFKSLNTGIYSVLAKGSQGNTVIYRITSEVSGYTYSQDYTVNLVRIPTLASITVMGTDEDGREVPQAATELFDSTKTAYTYKVLDSVRQVVVSAVPYQESDDYTITLTGAGQSGDARNGVAVDIPGNRDSVLELVVSANGQSNTYRLTIQPGEGKTLTMVCQADVELEVFNSNDMLMPYTTSFSLDDATQKIYKYTLIPGETYRYIATYNTHYHATDEVRLKSDKNTTVTVDFAGMEDWLTELAFGIGGNYASYKGNLKLSEPFSPEKHVYQVSCVDTVDTVYAWAKVNTSAKTEIRGIYQQVFPDVGYHGISNEVEIDTGLMGTSLVRFLMYQNPIENTLTVRLSRTIDGVLHYQDYQVEFQRELTLESLEAHTGETEIPILQESGKQGFVPSKKNYSLKVSMAATALDLKFSRYTGNTSYGEEEVGYRVLVNGEDLTDAGMARIPLDGTIHTQIVEITVKNPKAPEGTAVYTLSVLKSPPVETTFHIVDPENNVMEDALLNIRETLSGQRLWPDENGKFQLCEGYSYEYALTRYQYISRSGVLTVTQNDRNELVIVDGSEQYRVDGTAGGGAAEITWSMYPAPANSSIIPVSAEWPNFRGDNSNNAVTSAPVPYLAEEGTLYWAQKRGDGFDADAVGSPILVGGDIITYAGDSIFRMDTMTGEIKASGIMDHKSSFSITPPTYANGMVFVALSDGCVQAFNASTLESLWIYKDPLGGQPNCPITVKNGYLYTGFWNSETANARFVCLSITDEDPTETKEAKCASWFWMAKGGFYWAGAYVSDQFVLVGTDDGTNLCTSYSSQMLLLDARTGKLLDSWDNLHGDIRCTVVYDDATNAYYFTSKGGTFYSMQVDTSTMQLTSMRSLPLANGSSQPPMSTSSPVVYNGRAYVGVSGAAQFGQYTGHNITVIDVPSWRIAYTVPTQGYPQTSGLLTTAYGDAYVYFFDNYTPGKLRVLRDAPGQTQATMVNMEETNTGKYTTAYALFTPVGEHAQYAICSPVVDRYGTVYFKNDSAYLMAFGSAIESIEVKQAPTKKTYIAGETFDPAGMMVVANYANGITQRDITQYVTYSTDKLTEADENFTIRFELVQYHNKEDGQEMIPGEKTTTPTCILELDITSGVLGDVNCDGEINALDPQLILEYEAQNLKEDLILVVSDVSGDGAINSDDAVLIWQYLDGTLDRFPAAPAETEGTDATTQTQDGT